MLPCLVIELRVGQSKMHMPRLCTTSQRPAQHISVYQANSHPSCQARNGRSQSQWRAMNGRQ